MRPPLADDTAFLAAIARDIAATRRRDYPALVAAGKLPAAEAEHQQGLADDIAADWAMLAGQASRPGRRTSAFFKPFRIATLERAHTRCTARADALRAGLDKVAADHLFRAGRRVHADLAEKRLAPALAAGLRPWAAADDYAEAAAALLWWERRPCFPWLRLGEMRRLASLDPSTAERNAA